MPHNQKTAAERAQDIIVSQGGVYAKDPWKPVELPLKNKPPIQDGTK